MQKKLSILVSAPTPLFLQVGWSLLCRAAAVSYGLAADAMRALQDWCLLPLWKSFCWLVQAGWSLLCRAAAVSYGLAADAMRSLQDWCLLPLWKSFCWLVEAGWSLLCRAAASLTHGVLVPAIHHAGWLVFRLGASIAGAARLLNGLASRAAGAVESMYANPICFMCCEKLLPHLSECVCSAGCSTCRLPSVMYS